MTCATAGETDCLGRHEYHAADIDQIASRWPDASLAQRRWLARWAKPSDPNRQFFVDAIAAADSETQYEILTSVLSLAHNRDGDRLKAALSMIEQVATDPSRRPARVMIDFATDHGEGMIGGKAYEDHGGYPDGLDEAFQEVMTYPDLGPAMSAIAGLDHPWLATQAAFWFFFQGRIAEAMQAMRFTVDANGIPAPYIIKSIPVMTQNVALYGDWFVQIVLRGELGDWNALARDEFVELLDQSGVRTALVERAKGIPDRARKAGIKLDADQALEVQVQTARGFRDEVQGVQWFVGEVSKKYPEDVALLAQTYAQEEEVPWQALAMVLWASIGDSRALDLAHRLADSTNSDVRDSALGTISLFAGVSASQAQ
ncbi:hypothetical protein [Dokdonella sp.]|uniref:hypothetical protein n=1 Tax=Dokdonella sp. TaxID=2291710 RepID=UPI00352850A4